MNILPERPCTAHFVLPAKDTPLSQVFTDFKNCGIRAAGVRCLQRSPNGFVSVTFCTSEYRDCFLRQSSFISRRARRNSSSFTFVVIYDAPYELLDEALSHRLSHYGSVHGIRRCGLQGYDGIHSGTRVARMELSESIPSFMRFGRKVRRIKHEGQIPTCRKCHLPDRVARACPNVICFNCDQLGHTFSDCTEDTKCSICKEDGHYAIDCRMSWWCRPALADIDVPATPVSHPSHLSTDVPPAGSPPPSDVYERPPPVPSPQPLSDDSSSQPPSDVPPSSVPLSAPSLQSSLSPRHRRLRLLLVCLLLRILRCGFLCIIRSLLKIPLSSLQTLHSSRSLNRSSSLLSLPPTRPSSGSFPSIKRYYWHAHCI